MANATPDLRLPSRPQSQEIQKIPTYARKSPEPNIFPEMSAIPPNLRCLDKTRIDEPEALWYWQTLISESNSW